MLRLKRNRLRAVRLRLLRQAEQGLKSFVSTLTRLKKIGEKGLGLSSVMRELREVQEVVGELDPTNVTSLARAGATQHNAS